MKKILLALILLSNPCFAGQINNGGSSGGGGGGTPGGTSGQVQYNNAGSFAGFTMGGDCTLVTSTGVVTCTKTNGTSFGALATLSTVSAYSTLSNNTSSAAAPVSNAALFLGVPGFTPIAATTFQGTSSTNGSSGMVVQNTSSGTAASADISAQNNLGTATTYFANIGQNSSNYSGTGSISLPNAGYFLVDSGDLVIDTNTSNAIHFEINNGATDAMTIGTTGRVGIGTQLPASALDVVGRISINGVNGISYPATDSTTF